MTAFVLFKTAPVGDNGNVWFYINILCNTTFVTYKACIFKYLACNKAVVVVFFFNNTA